MLNKLSVKLVSNGGAQIAAEEEEEEELVQFLVSVSPASPGADY